MDLKKLMGLRPKEETPAAIQTAIESAEGGKQASLARAAELESNRGAMLLSGDARTIEAAEAELLNARMEAERYGAMAVALKPKLETAQRQKKVAEIRAAAKEAEDKAAAFVTWWNTHYRGLAEQMREGARMEVAAEVAASKLASLAGQDHEAWDEAGVMAPRPPTQQVHKDTDYPPISVLAGPLRLPPPQGVARPMGNVDPFWPEFPALMGSD